MCPCCVFAMLCLRCNYCCLGLAIRDASRIHARVATMLHIANDEPDLRTTCACAFVMEKLELSVQSIAMCLSVIRLLVNHARVAY